MESSAIYQLTRGYLPYTLGPIFLIFCGISYSRSSAAIMAGGVIFIFFSFVLLLFQLFIFALPTRNKWVFHGCCLALTLFNTLVMPAAIGAFLNLFMR